MSDRPVRLEVNVGDQTAAALRELMESKGITATECVRRAVSVWKYFEDKRAEGWSPAITKEGHTKEVVWE